jgi:hypothetical protein
MVGARLIPFERSATRKVALILFFTDDNVGGDVETNGSCNQSRKHRQRIVLSASSPLFHD